MCTVAYIQNADGLDVRYRAKFTYIQSSLLHVHTIKHAALRIVKCIYTVEKTLYHSTVKLASCRMYIHKLYSRYHSKKF
jgi:hypothetical protein